MSTFYPSVIHIFQNMAQKVLIVKVHVQYFNSTNSIKNVQITKYGKYFLKFLTTKEFNTIFIHI